MLTTGRWALVIGALVVGMMPQISLAGPSACIPPGGRATCKTDDQCCDGAVCGGGLCKRGCKINKVFYDNGTINRGNDCQWCQSSTNRFGWTNRVSGAACGDQTNNECTNPDTCNGSGTCLPNHEPVTTTCGDDEGPCTNQDYCDGLGGCTDEGYKPATTSCTGTSQGGECDDDAADHCTGTDGSCVDEFKASGTFCGDSGTECRNQDTCDGSSGQCTDNGFKSATTSCTGASQGDECDDDAADHCIGTSNSCVDEFKPIGAFCGDSGTECRNQDTCSGSSGRCTDNGFKSASATCGSHIATDCDNPDMCDGSGSCQDNHKADGTGCTTDGNACTNDVCASGVCTHPNEPIGTACGNAGTACRNADACDGAGGCTVGGFKSASTPCTGTLNGGACDGVDHCSGTDDTCVDVFQPSSHACVLPTDAFGNYACREVAYCTGTSSTCPTPDIGVFDPTIPCRDGGFGADAFCNPPEYCTSYGVCAAPYVLPGGTCDGGARNGQYCDLYEENVLGHPQCGDGGHCVATVCPGATLPCENPWTCDYAGHCLSNGYLPAGTDCIGDYACEKYSCDTAGNCVDQNITRSATAQCRSAANECDVAEFCGNPSTVPSNGRYDFTDYPDCGPDEKKLWGTACTYHPLGADAPGKCSGGECLAYYCKNSIECPDGWVCGCPPGQVCPTTYCVPALAEGGYGDVCSVAGRCNKDAESPGRACTSRQECDPGNIRPDAKCVQSSCDFNSGVRQGVGCESDSECRNATHPSGECVPDTRGNCGSIPGRTFDYVCCAGMAGDGLGGTPALGVTGRCQECCGSGGAPDQNCRDQDATDGTTSFQCCDGKCTDVVSDIHNCVSCNYDGSGFDCTDLISACSPGVAKCDAINIGGGCVMTEYCGDTVQQNGWVAASCEIPQVRVPVPDCDYCVFPASTPGTPCLTDAECGGFPGSCYHDLSLFCFARTQYAYADAPECRVAPFTGCTPTCTEVGNEPNVGDECESDADCRGGTTCKTSCDLSQVWDIAFCFENPTCQW